MSLADAAAGWAYAYPYAAAIVGAATVAALGVTIWRLSRAIRQATRPPATVLIAAAAAAACTAYSADTSWRFAQHTLGMTDEAERIAMFAVAEGALLACSLLARANKTATATDDDAGSAGTPGLLVWGITLIQIIPAYAESGFWGGTVRAAIGPGLAGLLWHQAMGLEIRIIRPGALSSGLLARIGRDLRERLLSQLGLGVRDRSAEQITRDRATARAARLASRRWLGPWGKYRLAAAATRSRATVDGKQRHVLMQDLAGRRTAGMLRTVPVESPWVPQTVPEAYPRTPLGVAGAALRTADPLAAVRHVDATWPGRTPAEVAALCTEYGVPVSETQVRIALGAGNPPRAKAAPEAPAQPTLTAVPDPVPAPVPGPDLHLDVTTAPEVHPDVAQPVPDVPEVGADVPEEIDVLGADVPEVEDGVPDEVGAPVPDEADVPEETGVPEVENGVPDEVGAPVPDGTDVPEDAAVDFLAQAHRYDADHTRTHGRPAPIRALKAYFHLGQDKATALRRQLDARPRATAKEATP